MKLYYTTGACSMASNIALREAGIPFEMSKVDKRTKRADGVDFVTINPKGYVPALQLDDGQVLTENVAVLQYIADLNPAAKLAPPLPANGQLSLFTEYVPHPAVDALREVKLDGLSPMQAFDALRRLHALLQETGRPARR